MRNYEKDATMSAIYTDSAHAQLRRWCHHVWLIFLMIPRMRTWDEDVNARECY